MRVAVVGGANVDVSARPDAELLLRDSNPGRVCVSFGGVGRNVAHDLCLFGAQVSFVSVFGDDFLGRSLMDDCRMNGMDLTLAEQAAGCRSNFYVCLNDGGGDMLSAVADMASMERVTPEFLAVRMAEINRHDLAVADTNLSESALSYLIENVSVPLFVDAVSTAKAMRLRRALERSAYSRLFALKVNRLEAETMTDCADLRSMAARLHALGVERLYITLGADGVFCSDGQRAETLPCLATRVADTTGAGDAFLAGAAFAFLRGSGLAEAAAVGLRTAQIALQAVGAVNPELRRFAEICQNTNTKKITIVL